MSPVTLRAGPGHAATIATLFRQDVRSWVREGVLFILSFIGVFIYAGISWLMPDVVDESFHLAVYMPAGAPAFVPDEAGLVITRYDTTDALVKALDEGTDDALVGLAFADDTIARAQQGLPPIVTVYVSPKAPPELREAAKVMVTELAYAAAGKPLPVTLPDDARAIRGEDRQGKQASLRAKMRPMASLMVLALEMMSIASLLSREIQNRTVVAVLATPATVFDWVSAKLLFGAFVAFSQAFLLLVLIGAFFTAPIPLFVLVVLGTLLFTALGMIAGVKARDFTEVLFYAFALIVPTVIPAFSVMLPGSSSAIVKAIPTYPLAVAIFDATSGASFAQLLPHIAWAAAWVVALLALAVTIVTRKVTRL